MLKHKEKRSKTEIIANLLFLNPTRSAKEIAFMAKADLSLVYKVKKEIHPKCFEESPVLNPENYAYFYNRGITSKEKLARIFNLSRQAIYNFENKGCFKELFRNYIQFRNTQYSLKGIYQALMDIYNLLVYFEPLSPAAREMKKIIKAFEKYAQDIERG